ncbi:Ku protein [Roseiterribacter gracilis]|uniref:Non-homologous end joining protein Ku n=1 Tax=Roseiterribacter gracilis TaxID=2812848 RepID=A0A8S8X8B7_9PROT|nr:non-homologous end joining protein Ku [Rhodospirillales bacterium TMPK1]
MAAPSSTRSSWKGHLKLSLVTAAVRLSPATTGGERISFNMLNKDTGNRVKQQLIDSETGDVVERSDTIKGYEIRKGEYVEITQEDLDKVQVPTSHMIEIERFVDAADVNEIYLESPYYVVPDGAVADEAYVVIREAMHRSGKAAVARVTLSSREHPVLIKPCENGLILTTLRDEREVRQAKDYFADVRDLDVSEELVDVAQALIKRLEGPFDPAMFEDRYQTALRELVDAKAAGRKLPEHAAATETGKVINLMDALKRSLGQSGGSAPAAAKPARAAAKSAGKAATKTPAKSAAKKTASGGKGRR